MPILSWNSNRKQRINQPLRLNLRESAYQVHRNVYVTLAEKEFYFQQEQMEQSLHGVSIRFLPTMVVWKIQALLMIKIINHNIWNTSVRILHGSWVVLPHVLLIFQILNK